MYGRLTHGGTVLKTNRLYRIFKMAIAAFCLAFLRLFRRFTKLTSFPESAENLKSDRTPAAARGTRPEDFDLVSELELNGERIEEYERAEKVSFDAEEEYSDLEGITTFRGNHRRDGGSFGKPDVREEKLEIKWNIETGSLRKSYGKGFWTGSGWTGQPLIVRWSAEQREKMNIASENDKLAEAIYATMDGNVYFLDIKDGSRTRETVAFGLPFKGAGALDPRGNFGVFGAGDDGPGEDGAARAVFMSLYNTKKIYELGAKDSFAPRIFHGYDSSMLVDKKTDTLFQPGENGIIYSMKLNTSEDGEQISPSDILKLRYTSPRNSEEKYWLGMEDSAVFYKNYMYIADNGGNLLCIDVNTMKIIWVQDVCDDTNGSPVLAIEDGVPYIYIATSLHWTSSKVLRLADVPLFKINALTGEYVWIRTYFCNTVAGVSGGVQATPVVGKGEIENLVIFPVARTPQVRSGILVALDRKTGEEVWKLPMRRYAWSSPVAVYSESGKAYIVAADSDGRLYLIEGKTGKLLSTAELGANIEATPAVFEDMIVVGTRGRKIFGIQIK